MAGRSVMLGVAVASLALTATLAAQPASDSGKDRLICRKATKSLSSRIRNPRRCLRESQWQQEQAEAEARASAALTTTEGQNDGHPATRPQ